MRHHENFPYCIPIISVNSIYFFIVHMHSKECKLTFLKREIHSCSGGVLIQIVDTYVFLFCGTLLLSDPSVISFAKLSTKNHHPLPFPKGSIRVVQLKYQQGSTVIYVIVIIIVVIIVIYVYVLCIQIFP